MRLRLFWNRARGSTLKESWSLLAPRQVDLLLYEAPEYKVEVLHTLPQAISIHRYSSETIPPNMHMVSLTPDRRLYVMFEEEKNRPIHWTVVHSDGALPARFGYDPAAPVVGDSFTDEHYRGHHIFPHVLSRILADLRQSGVATTYALVSPTNTASIHGLERAGFRVVSRLRGFMFLGLFLWRSQGRGMKDKHTITRFSSARQGLRNVIVSFRDQSSCGPFKETALPQQLSHTTSEDRST